MNIKLKTVIVQIGVGSWRVRSAGCWCAPISYEFVREYPELAHMRVPVLSLAFSS